MNTFQKIALLPAGALVFYAFNAPVDENAAKEFLEKQGYANVRIAGPAGKCGKHKRLFTFTATAPGGKSNAGEVCLDGLPFFSEVRVN